MNKLLLGLLSLFSGFWRRMDVNPIHLRNILAVKLKMDGRRKTAFNYRQSAQKKEVKGQDILMMFMMSMMGLLFMLPILLFKQSGTGMFILLSGWMSLLTLTLISDFTDVLIDVRDNYILLPRPVTGKTLAISRILHVFFYLVKLMIPFSLPGMIGIGIKFGLFPVLLFVVLILLSVLLTIFVVNLLYLIMLNLLSPRKFKEIINYFQIAFYALVFLGYQILPRMMDFRSQGDVNLLEKIYLWPLPSVWLAYIWEIAFDFDQPWTAYVLAGLGLLTPFLAVYLVTTVLSKNFSQKMFSIGEGGGAESAPESKGDLLQSPRKSWSSITGVWFCTSKLERAIYAFTWKLTGRSRDFKLKYYPNLIMLPVYFVFAFVFPMTRSESDGLAALRQSNIYLFGFYFSMIILLSGLTMLQFSERYKASWFYRAMPLAQPGLILTGAFKAIIVKYYLPIYLLITLFSGFVWGWHILDDALLALFTILALTTGIATLTNHVLPFTRSWDEATRSNIGFTLLTMFCAGLFGLFHYFIANMGWVIWILIPTAAALFYLAMYQYRKTSWKQVKWE